MPQTSLTRLEPVKTTTQDREKSRGKIKVWKALMQLENYGVGSYVSKDTLVQAVEQIRPEK